MSRGGSRVRLCFAGRPVLRAMGATYALCLVPFLKTPKRSCGPRSRALGLRSAAATCVPPCVAAARRNRVVRLQEDAGGSGRVARVH